MELRRTWGAGSSESNTRAVPAHEELRRTDRSTLIAVGTLACGECDAPIAIGGTSLTPSDQLTCPYCLHEGPVREFLSLARPTRPTRVVVRIARASRSRG